MSAGLSQVSPTPGVVSNGIPSTTYSGSLLPMKVDGPRIRMEKPPAGVRITCTPAKRPAISCSTCSTGTSP